MQSSSPRSRHTDIPTPDLIRTSRQQFWLLVFRMSQLIAPLFDSLIFIEYAVHCPDGAEVDAIIE